MAMVAHVKMLEEKHGKLEALIFDQSHRPQPDFEMIQTLKKQKLLIKEEIARLNVETERIHAA